VCQNGVTVKTASTRQQEAGHRFSVRACGCGMCQRIDPPCLRWGKGGQVGNSEKKEVGKHQKYMYRGSVSNNIANSNGISSHRVLIIPKGIKDNTDIKPYLLLFGPGTSKKNLKNE